MTLSISSLYRGGGDFVLPNVSYVEGDNTVHYHPVPPPGAGTIVYKSGSDLLTVDYTLWDNSMGTPVGVLVIPEGFAPDKKARMLSLYWASETGTGSTSASAMKWCSTSTDSSLVNHTMIPTTDNAGSTTTGAAAYAYLPSDKFTGTVSYVDPLTQYSGTSRTMIPSPYLGDKPNPAYYAPISGYNNALSDFNGKSNTNTLVALGTGYTAANAARNYKAAGAEEIEWYLPSAGEIGYILPRFNVIQAALTKLAVSNLETNQYYWSSTEHSSSKAYSVSTGYGDMRNSSKVNTSPIRPFALLP